MIERFLIGVQRALASVIGVLVMFGLLVGLVIWARNDPAALQALVTKLVNAAVSLIAWGTIQPMSYAPPAPLMRPSRERLMLPTTRRVLFMSSFMPL